LLGAGCAAALVDAGAAEAVALVAAVLEPGALVWESVAADAVVAREPVPVLVDEHAVRASSTAATAATW
jgi:hypothetical protein